MGTMWRKELETSQRFSQYQDVWNVQCRRCIIFETFRYKCRHFTFHSSKSSLGKESILFSTRDLMVLHGWENSSNWRNVCFISSLDFTTGGSSAQQENGWSLHLSYCVRIYTKSYCCFSIKVFSLRYGHTVVGPTNVIQDSKTDKSVSVESQRNMLNHIYRYITYSVNYWSSS